MRRIAHLTSRAALLCRTCASAAGAPDVSSSPTDLVTVRESPLEEVFLLEMNNGRANLLTPEFISAFLKAINEVCTPEKFRCRGIILTSKNPGIFSAGLDLNELNVNLSQERFAHYWNQFQQLFITLHSMPVPLAAAINGHAAAGGCIMALASDYRVMARRHPVKHTDLTIGISATRYGFVVPPYVAGSMEHVVGFRKAEGLLSLGELVSADEALRIGLVDQVVDNPDEAVVPCLEFMEKLLELPSPVPFWMVKDMSRRRVLAPLCTPALRTQDTVDSYNMFSNPQVKETLGRHTKNITGK
ncbi:putative mitochondrial 3,2-trans-enoyl-CoA isomerase, mitochondrial precursor-like protein [Leptomonas pyrrhocoris]|uniref:Enoyl-CoA delta isomerase 1, mitochondrial n=1 Tax=Leptomonas pyrrhocoris TaxID=157538 RepID=A0A0N0DVL2_LEPPY|nr:putative mitochondrial 3,2-trans-enoyl-CoA isomerase, mitochondrial precursor-like protein [Leptomonas pyrrhocoris]XP_015658693.1 putative mitochondrial 3,2-trans-enoyl-CoA isomerase, mitochondrial precursor-like protein [Leptomonas pyrrhocoris]KPA80253.1 putative mitochondrial 3,2-trans-enoyl-CoA isomerase, mitochondrial precursor-like protein [Leptomonas pyrrhocoris]KPA80254.1 putative mitochondrial 3,2-trans-enoyl-CoA isomerase, mitochondrial precursor-like protein [Leptomonas pyrrhocoris]|eukprot:XP_015658692.1 putative mitochondrial 3,2-trans-enoyl-CoA isomerase, mitochondrial precursor-like protein [Leptomonas pyrrhocoris]